MLQVLLRKDLQPCFIAIFVSMFVQMGICGTLTMQLMQVYGCSAQTAYYFFAVWGTGLTLGNCLSSCLINKTREAVLVSFLVLILSLLIIGPSQLTPFLNGFDDSVKLGLIAFGLFFMGLSSAFLQTLSNISSMERA